MEKIKIIEKIKNNSLTVKDIKDFLELVKELGNQNEEIQAEIKDFNTTFQFNTIDGPSYWLKFGENKITYGEGQVENPEVVFSMGAETILKLFAGDMDPTKEYLDGNLKIAGPIPKAIKLRVILEMIREDLEAEFQNNHKNNNK